MSAADEPDDGEGRPDDASEGSQLLEESEKLEHAAPVPLPSKVDPESLVLRGSPQRVVRFRREVIIGIAAIGAFGLASTAWIALVPSSSRVAAAGEETSEGRDKRQPEAVAGAPGTYDEIPKLGPPLPGDLGRPILDQQRKLASEDAAPASGAADDPAAAARERALAEEAAARQSAVLMSVGVRTPAIAASVPLKAAALADQQTNVAGLSPAPSRADDGGNDAEVSPHRIRPAASPWILSSGSVIAASLVTGLNSDLPGIVVAQVSENIYDSITGRTLLIPQGARLIGRYESTIAFGQRRAFVAWQRIIWPDGSSVTIDNAPASDVGGYAGLADKVDFHSWSLLKGVGLSTLLGVGTELSLGGNESDLVRALRESAQQSGARAGDRLVDKSLAIEPTITIRPGSPVRVIVHKDIVLQPWRP